jgi:hypothetical protein
MSLSPIEVLKHRLASGEISVAQYQELLTYLKADDKCAVSSITINEAVSQSVAAAKTVAAKIRVSLFGPESYNEPTDTSPLRINSRLTIYGSYFKHKEERINILDIISIGAEFRKETTNLVWSISDSLVTLVLKNGENIQLTGFSMLTDGRTNKIVNVAYQVLSDRTFATRYQNAVNELNTNGFIKLHSNQIIPMGRTKLTRDGYLIKGSSKVSLRTAARNGYLLLGTAWGDSMAGAVNPYELVAGENGIGAFSGRIKLEIVFDTDVVFELIRRFAGIE